MMPGTAIYEIHRSNAISGLVAQFGAGHKPLIEQTYDKIFVGLKREGITELFIYVMTLTETRGKISETLSRYSEESKRVASSN